MRLFVEKGKWCLEFEDGGFCPIGRVGHVAECARWLRDLLDPCLSMD